MNVTQENLGNSSTRVCGRAQWLGEFVDLGFKNLEKRDRIKRMNRILVEKRKGKDLIYGYKRCEKRARLNLFTGYELQCSVNNASEQ